MRQLRNKLPYVKPTITKLIEGGTGAIVESQALTNLNAVPASLIDKAGGILSLDVDRKLKSEVIAGLSVTGISVDGPTSLSVNQVQAYTITDYDAFLSYTISAIGGSVSRSGDTITYTAPASAGPSGFIINGKTITIAVSANIVLSPTINNIINGANNIDSTISLTSTAFTVSSGSDTHQFTDWQIATDSGFTSIVTQSISDTVNKTSWVSGTLQPATTYYARVRYKGNAYGYSNWSSIITFTTKTTFLPTSEKAILSVNGEYTFGYSVSINTDATRVAIGCPNSSPGGNTFIFAGAVYIFFKSGSSWIQESKLVASDKHDGNQFGKSVYLDSTATRVVIGANRADTTSIDSGKAYIFTRTGTSWAQEQILTASDKSIGDSFGFSVTIDNNGNRCMVSSPSRNSAQGAVYVFTRSGTTWTEETIILADVPQINGYFGYSISVDSTGTRIAIGAFNYPILGNARGKVFIYIRSGTVWTLEQGFISSDGTTGNRFGCSVDIDDTGTRVVIGAYFVNIGALGLAGKTYIFTRTGTSWAQEAILTASDKATNNYFGTSVSCNFDCSIIVIGAVGATVDGVNNTGKAYIFTRSGTTWIQNNFIYPISKYTNDQFGCSVDISKDSTRVAVGAYLAYVGASVDTGKVVIFG